MTKVLVAEKIGDSGVGLLKDAGFDVDVKTDWADGELAESIGQYDGILIRSATKLTADLLERADNLRAVGRAGVGVDNVDVEAATRRGVVVANAPQSNVITAAEHTLALLLALARNVPRPTPRSARARGTGRSSAASRCTRRRSASSASGASASWWPSGHGASGCGSWPSTPSWPGSASPSWACTGRLSDELYAESDFITIHLPKNAETENFLDAEAFSKMKDGVRVLNVARGPLLVEEDLKEAIDSGKVAGAALDVFREEPITEHPLFGYPNVIVTPHLGASTAEATDRAGFQAAEQVAAALTGGVVTSAVNVPAVAPRTWRRWGRSCPWPSSSAGSPWGCRTA